MDDHNTKKYLELNNKLLQLYKQKEQQELKDKEEYELGKRDAYEWLISEKATYNDIKYLCSRIDNYYIRLKLVKSISDKFNVTSKSYKWMCGFMKLIEEIYKELQLNSPSVLPI